MARFVAGSMAPKQARVHVSGGVASASRAPQPHRAAPLAEAVLADVQSVVESVLGAHVPADQPLMQVDDNPKALAGNHSVQQQGPASFCFVRHSSNKATKPLCACVCHAVSAYPSSRAAEKKMMQPPVHFCRGSGLAALDPRVIECRSHWCLQNKNSYWYYHMYCEPQT